MTIPRTPPPRVSSSQITDDDNDKFRFLDAVEGTPWPDSPFNRWDVFIKRSCLKGATQEEKMNFYVKTAAQILGSSEEEAKERIYKITADCSYDGFGLQIGFSRMSNFEGLRSIIDKENLEIPDGDFRWDPTIPDSVMRPVFISVSREIYGKQMTKLRTVLL
ncbi:hypothetical protein CASFOL_036398 [Castilleja foliolosa]|uniref:MORF/ORRM1/DAG-like MORF domain-containing protein n=1 Tax=Castilleja foliolosa TaxID=1961234 RepID=A0ABD3BVG5_9LAMI